jgi:hypothetical protein
MSALGAALSAPGDGLWCGKQGAQERRLSGYGIAGYLGLGYNLGVSQR